MPAPCALRPAPCLPKSHISCYSDHPFIRGTSQLKWESMENSQDRFTRDPRSNHVESQTRSLIPAFTGSGGEYFRIWIVNVALTVLTLGIYGAWAKVRTRRYFYANTILDGQPFDYLARPGTILRGYLIVGGALVAINVSNKMAPLFGFLISTVAWSFIPYLLYKAHRFKAMNSAYRNVRFRFTGDLWGAYVAYAIFPLAALMSLIVALPVLLGSPGGPELGAVPGGPAVGLAALSGLALAAAYPYMVFLKRRYFHDNMAYGKTESSFSGRARPFYGIFLRAFGLLVGVGFGGVLLVVVTGGFATSFVGGAGEPDKVGLISIVLLSNAIIVFMFLLVQQYIYARIFNYAWGHSRLETVTFQAGLGARKLTWIRFTNLVAIFLSLGFLIPWAKVRRTRYILSKTTVLLRGDMGAFETDSVPEEGAVGDTAADFFDWDIGW